MEKVIIPSQNSTIEDLVKVVVAVLQNEGLISESDFDVLCATSLHWLNANDNIQVLSEKESILILVFKVIKNRYGDDASFCWALVKCSRLGSKLLKEKEKEDILNNIANPTKELLDILTQMDKDTMDKIARIITLQPNFMGIGVNLNELFTLLKKMLKK